MEIIQTAPREQKIRLALQGGTGSGKTMSALLMAYGITGDWKKVCIIDTEYGAASLYRELGPYHTILLGPPYTPMRYLHALELCETSGMEVIIIDSLSPEWVGELGVINLFCLTEGNACRKWSEAIPQHNLLLDHLQNSPCHVIATVRTQGSTVYQEEGYAHHFTTVLELDRWNEAYVIKDRTGLFRGREGEVITEATGKGLLKWCKDITAPVIQDPGTLSAA